MHPHLHKNNSNRKRKIFRKWTHGGQRVGPMAGSGWGVVFSFPLLPSDSASTCRQVEGGEGEERSRMETPPFPLLLSMVLKEGKRKPGGDFGKGGGGG